MRASVKMSLSSRLFVENSLMIAPSGPAWNQWFVSGCIVYWSPSFRTISWRLLGEPLDRANRLPVEAVVVAHGVAARIEAEVPRLGVVVV